jgi:hypothetical protein
VNMCKDATILQPAYSVIRQTVGKGNEDEDDEEPRPAKKRQLHSQFTYYALKLFSSTA